MHVVGKAWKESGGGSGGNGLPDRDAEGRRKYEYKKKGRSMHGAGRGEVKLSTDRREVTVRNIIGKNAYKKEEKK